MFLSLEKVDFDSAIDRMKKNQVLLDPIYPEQISSHDVDWLKRRLEQGGTTSKSFRNSMAYHTFHQTPYSW